MSTHMPFVYCDGGRSDRFKAKAGDCVTRALAIAMQRPYADVYRELSDCTRMERRTRGRKLASARDGVHVKKAWFKRYMTAYGWRFVPTMSIGSGCTVHLVAGELPMGRLIVSVSGHYTTVIDGVVHDTHDPQRTTYHGVPGPGVRTSERCVYGYWTHERQA